MTTNDKKTIAICIPGEHFSSVWVVNFIALFAEVFNRYNVIPLAGYSSNVYATRARMLQSLIDTDEQQQPIDYVLWIDDDNVLSFPQFDRLLQTLESDDALDAAAAWCWIQPDGYGIAPLPSCGHFNGNRVQALALNRLVILNDVEPAGPDLQEVDYTGFPAVLIRMKALSVLGKDAFNPILAADTDCGFMGEDTSFWKRAQRKGLKLVVDRRVKVPHYKLRAAEPVAVDPANVATVK